MGEGLRGGGAVHVPSFPPLFPSFGSYISPLVMVRPSLFFEHMTHNERPTFVFKSDVTIIPSAGLIQQAEMRESMKHV